MFLFTNRQDGWKKLPGSVFPGGMLFAQNAPPWKKGARVFSMTASICRRTYSGAGQRELSRFVAV
jgi:hypothetical protein